MAYQRGCIRKVKRKNGEAWVLRFREDTADGGRRERVVPIGMLRDFPKESDARREVDRRGLLVSVNAETTTGRSQAVWCSRCGMDCGIELTVSRSVTL
jgi:hypothetical protein